MIRRRNRKKRKLDVSMIPVPFAVVVVLIASIALGYVWLQCRCDCLGKEIKQLERTKADLDRKILNEEYKWMRMKSPGNIEESLAKFGIEMTWPRRDQIVRRCTAEITSREFNGPDDYSLKYASIGMGMIHE